MSTVYYDANDMVKAGCNECRGCADCCQGMGDSILLDPYDIWQLETNLHTTFVGLLQENVRLCVTDGLILPSLGMQGEAERCVFLNGENRCAVHAFRPGLCRLFPLGRRYEGHVLRYFLLEGACVSPNHTKVKVKKWLAVPELKRYEAFLVRWHEIRKDLTERIAGQPQDEELQRRINVRLLHYFYEEQYAPEDFYGQFEERADRFEGEADTGR